jgi:hypothetical protein
MFKPLTTTLATLAIALAGAAAMSSASAATPVDGKSFSGGLWMQGEKAPKHDEFVFKDGMFRSTACDKYGFAAAPYRVSQDGDAMHVEAETMSPTQGRIVWKGTIRAGQFEGVSSWQPMHGKPVEAWFRAQAAN